MFRCLRNVVLASGFVALSSSQLLAQKAAPVPAAQEDSGWRISPEKINIQVGEDRPLQLLDDSAQERDGAVWSVDDPELADLSPDEHGRVVVQAKAVGTVRVSAAIGRERSVRDITIWPAPDPMPPGTTEWGVHPIGRELGDIPAVPTDDGPNMFSLEQTPSGRTYLRAGRDDGIQAWTWLLPEDTRDVELVCGDWFGGAVISANRTDSYTLYVVGKDGTLQWQYEAQGLRKGLAITTEHVVHLLSQSSDGTVASVAGLDEASGVTTYEIPLPGSYERLVSVRKVGTTFVCASASVSSPLPTVVSRPFVNMDGNAYVAFTQRATTLGIAACTPGSTVDPGEMYVIRDESLVLWQVHPDGTYRTTVVEAIGGEQPLSSPVTTFSPTISIVTDNMNGMLIPVQVSQRGSWGSAGGAVEEFVYRLDPAGDLVYKFPLPKYTGPLHDEMVIGEDDRAFATRGGVLIAFDVRTGNELWRWDSNTPEISVFAALANGNCAVQTPTALVEVENGITSKELVKGKAMMDWLGHMYIKHN